MSSEEGQGGCFWLFRSVALQLANISWAEPQKLILYELTNGTTHPCKGLEMKSFFIFHLVVLLYMFSRYSRPPSAKIPLPEEQRRGFGRSSSLSSCPALARLQPCAETPFLWARWRPRQLALVAKRASFIGRKNYKVPA